MTENIIGCNLTVSCLDKTEYTDVVLKVVGDTVYYVTDAGEELFGTKAVETIEAGNFLVPMFMVAQVIEQYRRQN